MNSFLSNLLSKKFISVLLVFAVFTPCFAAEKTEKEKLLDTMKVKIESISSAYEKINNRVAKIKDVGQKKAMDDYINTHKAPINAFTDINVDEKDSTFSDFFNSETLTITPLFYKYERAAQDALADFNLKLIAPPDIESLPKGDLMTDFIPNFIRQLFRFTFLMIFISFVVSGVFFVTANDDEDKLSKAKRILYFSLIGFLFVTFAFAIIKAVTNINFF